MFFHTIKQKIAKFMQRMFCRHDYTITALSGRHVSYRCVKCGKELCLTQSLAPKEMLSWGYGWYHGGPEDGVLDLLIHQPIYKNNEVHIPMNCVYVVSLLEKMDAVPYKDGHGGRIDFGDVKILSFCFEKDKAEDTVLYRIDSGLRDIYPFACIECYADGFTPYNFKEKIRFFRQCSPKTDGAKYEEFSPAFAAGKTISTVAVGIS